MCGVFWTRPYPVEESSQELRLEVVHDSVLWPRAYDPPRYRTVILRDLKSSMRQLCIMNRREYHMRNRVLKFGEVSSTRSDARQWNHANGPSRSSSAAAAGRSEYTKLCNAGYRYQQSSDAVVFMSSYLEALHVTCIIFWSYLKRSVSSGQFHHSARQRQGQCSRYHSLTDRFSALIACLGRQQK